MGYFIKSYSDYIKDYIINTDYKKLPGEHHFVSTYLLDRAIQITNKIPDYVNPDGVKDIAGGDLVWFNKDKYEFGIEVKLKDAKLSKKEFNEWLIKKNNTDKPKLFIGISTKGIILLKWNDFTKLYEMSVKNRKAKFPSNEIDKYGPSCSIDELFRNSEKYKECSYGFFKYSEKTEEDKFMKKLEELINK